MDPRLARLVDPRLLPLVDASRALYADRPARRGPAGPDELRAARAAATAARTTAARTTAARTTAASGSDPGAPAAPDHEIATADGRTVPVRLHRPACADPSGVVLDLHGGGFYLGSAADGDVRNRQLADALGVLVAAVDYRLAPEHPYPAAPDDCEAAALWLADAAASGSGPPALAVVGFSAGATLALTTLLRLRDRGVRAVTGAVLQFGTYDLSASTPAGRLIAGEYFLDAYAGSAPDRSDPDVSPIFADLAGLPPVLVVVGEDDVLLEDNLALAARLSGAGVDVDLRVYPASPHGFTAHPTPLARAARDDIESWLAARMTAGV